MGTMRVGREVGTAGINVTYGQIQEAYISSLYWPDCFPIYNRIRRSDPEVAVTRLIWSSFAQSVEFKWEHDEAASAAQQDFYDSVLDDMSTADFIVDLVNYTPFMGWSWFEALPGIRSRDWRAPGDDDWRSTQTDGRIGFRKLAFRDHSSFVRWDMDERSGKLNGMVQHDLPNEEVTIPLKTSVHVTFGDRANPEGLSPLEVLYRLENYMHNLEIVQGIGFEHAAGHANFRVTEGDISAADQTVVRNAARAILSAAEGNFMLLPPHIEGSVQDTAFSAAGSLLDAVAHYRMLKLAVFGAQWVAMSTFSGAGAMASMQDASQIFLTTFNSMMEGFARQVGRQLSRQLRAYNPAFLSSLKVEPRMTATNVEKNIDLNELSSFMSAMTMLELGEEDILAIRRKSGFLPEVIPLEETGLDGDEETEEDEPTDEPEEGDEPEQEQPEPDADLARKERYFPDGQMPAEPTPETADTLQEDLDRLLRRVERYAEENDMNLDLLLTATSEEELT